jgi:nucleotide-binding universal stress UspA family protein
MEKILAAIDGSESSLYALNQAVNLAVKWSAELLIISVVPPLSPLVYMGPAPMYKEQYTKVAKESHQRVLDIASEKIKNTHPDLKIETRLEEGRPSKVIVETAQNENVDLVVIGSRGIGGIKGWVLGSTSHKVVESCTKPVLIVK